MSETKLIFGLALVAVCIAMTTARGEKHTNLLKYACQGRNETSGEDLEPKDCGCDGEEIRPCSWSLSVVGGYGESLSLTFCDMSHLEEELPGVLKHACSVNFNGQLQFTRRCPAPPDQSVECGGTPLSVQIGDTLVDAYFCPLTLPRDGAHSHPADDDDDDTCIHTAPRGDSGSEQDIEGSGSSEGSSRPSPPRRTGGRRAGRGGRGRGGRRGGRN